MSSYAVTVLKIIASSGKWVLCKALKHSPKSGLNTVSATTVEKLSVSKLFIDEADAISDQIHNTGALCRCISLR